MNKYMPLKIFIPACFVGGFSGAYFGLKGVAVFSVLWSFFCFVFYYYKYKKD